MARRAHITVTLIEHHDQITMHFEDPAFPPVWFTKRERPVAYAKLRAILDETEFVEEIPVMGPVSFHSRARSDGEARSA